MPRKNEYTFIVTNSLTCNAAMRHAKFFAEMAAKKAGYNTSAVPRELKPGEEYHLIQKTDNIQSAG